MTNTIKISASLRGRLSAARFAFRVTRRAGTGLALAAVRSARMLATGSAPVAMRRPDAVMYLALERGLPVDDALFVHRQQRVKQAAAAAVSAPA